MKDHEAASEDFDMIVVGATGDLAQRKILPSLYLLHKDSRLSPQGRVFAVARLACAPETYLGTVEDNLRRYVPEGT